MSVLCHGGRLLVGKSKLTSHRWSVQPCVRPVSAVRMTAGHNALRGSGPVKSPHSDALAHVGCPDRRIDRLCITCCSSSQPSHHADLQRDLVTPQVRRVLVALALAIMAQAILAILLRVRWRRPWSAAAPAMRQPRSMLGAMDLGIADHGEGTGSEQAAQIAIALFADTPEPVLASARVLLRHEPIQAEKFRAERKALGSATLATRAVASAGPMPESHPAVCSSHWSGAKR